MIADISGPLKSMSPTEITDWTNDFVEAGNEADRHKTLPLKYRGWEDYGRKWAEAVGK